MTTKPTKQPKPKVKPTGASLYPDDVASVERIRQHFGLDNWSQALRRCIRLAVESIDSKKQAA